MHNRSKKQTIYVIINLVSTLITQKKIKFLPSCVK